MPTIKLRSQIGTDGILHLNIPCYNAWGNLVVEQSISQAISEMRRLQKNCSFIH